MAINQPGPAKNCSLNINSHQVGDCNRWRHCKPDITTSKWPKERFYDISSISVFFCKLKDLTQAINRSQSGSRNYYVLIGICVQENRVERLSRLIEWRFSSPWSWNSLGETSYIDTSSRVEVFLGADIWWCWCKLFRHLRLRLRDLINVNM